MFMMGCTGADEPATDAGESSGRGDSGAGVAEQASEVIVEQTVVARPGAPDEQATVGVQSLTVEGDAMVLRLVVTPDFAAASDSEKISLGDVWGESALRFGVTLRLLDRDNLKEHSVVTDTSGERWASSADVSSSNGKPMHAFAVFAAPEDDIDSVDVRLQENRPEFTDVPITR